MKKILILGGARQIGRRLLEKLLETPTAYQITTFNRGKTAPQLFPTIRKITGDRYSDDIQQLFTEDWDVVIDTSCFRALPLKKLVGGLQGRVKKYIFVSTISVYDYEQNKGVNAPITESFPRKSYTPEQIAIPGLKYYGQHKAASEDIIEQAGFDQHVILRPHFIYGKYDYQNLDYYWMYRVKKFDQAILPAAGQDIINWTYVDDLVQVIEQVIQNAIPSGKYNATTHDPVTHQMYLELLQKIIGRSIQFHAIPTAFLHQHNIRPVLDLPMWSDGSHFTFDNSKIKRALDLNFLPFEQSLQATYQWYNDSTEWKAGKLGLNRARELSLLEEWSQEMG